MWHRRFICLWAGQTLANLGDVFYIVAFISVMYAATGSGMYTAFIPVVIVASQSVSSLLAPLVFQRMSLAGMLVLSQGLKTILLAVASIAVSSGVGEQGEWIWLLFGLGQPLPLWMAGPQGDYSFLGWEQGLFCGERWTIDLLVFGASALVMGAIAEWQGVRAVYDVSAGLLLIAFLLALRLQKKQTDRGVTLN